MNVIYRFYQITNKYLHKFSATLVNAITFYRKDNSIEDIAINYYKESNINKDWERINDDYNKIGNDIRKAINSNVR